jgi:BolA protein
MSLESQIRQALESGFNIEVLEIENESNQHAGPATESHFKVVMVSPDFDGLAKVKRQQAVYKALGDLMSQFHALGLHTYSPEEWKALETVPVSPKCTGGHR